MNEKEILKETKDIKARIIYTSCFFILSIALGVICIAYSAMLIPSFICFCFFMFNGFMLLYKAIVFGFRRILGELK